MIMKVLIKLWLISNVYYEGLASWPCFFFFLGDLYVLYYVCDDGLFLWI